MGIGFINLNKIKGRLYVAFGSVTLLTIAAGAVALQGFASVEGPFQSVISRSIPTMETALELARSSASLSAAAPNLAGAQNPQESDKTMSGLEDRLTQIRELINKLGVYTGSEEVTTQLYPLVERFQGYLKTLNSEVNASLIANAELAKVADQVVNTHEEILAKIAPVLEVALSDVGKGSASLSIGGVMAVNNLMNTDLPHLIQLREIKTLTHRVTSLLVLSKNSDTTISVDADAAMTKSLEQISSRLAKLLKKQKLPKVKEAVENYVSKVSLRILPQTLSSQENLQLVLDEAIKSAHKILGDAMQKFMIDNSVRGSTLVNTRVKTVITLLRIEAKANRAAGLLATTANVNDLTLIKTLHEAVQLAVRQTSYEMGELKDKKLSEELGALGDNFNTLSEGKNGVSELRKMALGAKNKAAESLKNTQLVSEELSSAVDSIVSESRAEVQRGSDDIVAAFSNSKQFLLMIIGLSILIAGLITWLYVGRNLARRLDELTNATKAVAEGDLETEIAITGKDEIAEIAGALLTFKERLTQAKLADQETAREREQVAHDRKVEMDQMANDFDAGVGGVVRAVSSAASELTEASETMTETAEKTSSQSSIVATASDEASTNVQTVSAAAEELTASISEISRQVIQSSEIASRAVSDADETNDKIQGLAKAADKIGEVVALITDIAEQTNLLALNATIEAARAGDAGKGFAVVASEVKNLATQTARATDEISSQISGIQSATKESVVAIQDIGKTISEIDKIGTVIAASIEEQGSATQEIARNVEQAAVGTARVSSNIGGVTQAAGETGIAAEKIQVSASELTRQSEILRGEMDKFLTQIRTG